MLLDHLTRSLQQLQLMRRVEMDESRTRDKGQGTSEIKNELDDGEEKE